MIPNGHVSTHVPHFLQEVYLQVGSGEGFHDSGFEHQRQFRGHPLRKTVVLTPGPSSILYLWILNTIPSMTSFISPLLSGGILPVEPNGQEPVAPAVWRNPPKIWSSFAKASEDTRILPCSGDRGSVRRRVDKPSSNKTFRKAVYIRQEKSCFYTDSGESLNY